MRSGRTFVTFYQRVLTHEVKLCKKVLVNVMTHSVTFSTVMLELEFLISFAIVALNVANHSVDYDNDD